MDARRLAIIQERAAARERQRKAKLKDEWSEHHRKGTAAAAAAANKTKRMGSPFDGDPRVVSAPRTERQRKNQVPKKHDSGGGGGAAGETVVEVELRLDVDRYRTPIKNRTPVIQRRREQERSQQSRLAKMSKPSWTSADIFMQALRPSTAPPGVRLDDALRDASSSRTSSADRATELGSAEGDDEEEEDDRHFHFPISTYAGKNVKKSSSRRGFRLPWSSGGSFGSSTTGGAPAEQLNDFDTDGNQGDGDGDGRTGRAYDEPGARHRNVCGEWSRRRALIVAYLLVLGGAGALLYVLFARDGAGKSSSSSHPENSASILPSPNPTSLPFTLSAEDVAQSWSTAASTHHYGAPATTPNPSSPPAPTATHSSSSSSSSGRQMGSSPNLPSMVPTPMRIQLLPTMLPTPVPTREDTVSVYVQFDVTVPMLTEGKLNVQHIKTAVAAVLPLSVSPAEVQKVYLPSLPTLYPTPVPTTSPLPTPSPTAVPTQPTNPPTPAPTDSPSLPPSNAPTPHPTGVPLPQPTPLPTGTPQPTDTFQPSAVPVFPPTAAPTGTPSAQPTNTPQPTGTFTPTASPSLSSLPTQLPTPLPSQSYDEYSIEFKGTGSCLEAESTQDDHRANSVDECWEKCSSVFEEEGLTLVAMEYYADKSRGTDGCLCHEECECLEPVKRGVTAALRLAVGDALPVECARRRRRRWRRQLSSLANVSSPSSLPSLQPTALPTPTGLPTPLPSFTLPPTHLPTPFPTHAPSVDTPHYLNGQELSSTDVTMTVTLQIRASLTVANVRTYGDFRDMVESTLVRAEEDGTFEESLVAACGGCTAAVGYFDFPSNSTTAEVRDSFTFQNEPGETPRDYPTLHPTVSPSVTQMPTQCDNNFKLCDQLLEIYEPLGEWYPAEPLYGITKEQDDCWRYASCVPDSQQVCDKLFCRDEGKCKWAGMCEKACGYCYEQPTLSPTSLPTMKPTPLPSPLPTLVPSSKPSPVPTIQPTGAPTPPPTPSPTSLPTNYPTPACAENTTALFRLEMESPGPNGWEGLQVKVSIVGDESFTPLELDGPAGSDPRFHYICAVVNATYKYEWIIPLAHPSRTTTTGSAPVTRREGVSGEEVPDLFGSGYDWALKSVASDGSVDNKNFRTAERDASKGSFVEVYETGFGEFPTSYPTISTKPTPAPTGMPTRRPISRPTPLPSQKPSPLPSPLPTTPPTPAPTPSPTERCLAGEYLDRATMVCEPCQKGRFNMNQSATANSRLFGVSSAKKKTTTKKERKKEKKKEGLRVFSMNLPLCDHLHYCLCPLSTMCSAFTFISPFVDNAIINSLFS